MSIWHRTSHGHYQKTKQVTYRPSSRVQHGFIPSMHCGSTVCSNRTIMHTFYLIILILITASSCKEHKTTGQPLAAQTTAVRIRDSWKEAAKPLAIHIESRTADELKALKSLAVCTDEHRSSVRYRTSGTTLLSDEGLSLTDSSAMVFLCYPFRKDLSANDTLHLRQPFGEQLYGIEQSREKRESIHVRMALSSSMTLLRIHITSNSLRDRLDALELYGESLITEAGYMPFTGQWLDCQKGGTITSYSDGCLLNNGRNHDFYLVPTEMPSPITLLAKINGREHILNTTLPPLRPNHLIQLNTAVGDDNRLHITGSWVESERPFTAPLTVMADTVRIGSFLQEDGTISSICDSLSIALVIETDGTHGKAVALSDAEGLYTFGGRVLTSDKLFTTIDGTRHEGIINPHSIDDVPEEERIIFKPDMPYPQDCALGYVDGDLLTESLSRHVIPPASSPQMLSIPPRHKGSYIPSLAEMAALYYLTQPYSHIPIPKEFILPHGEYLTCSESSAETFYRIDMDGGIIDSRCSKQYGKGRIRLFYLF